MFAAKDLKRWCRNSNHLGGHFPTRGRGVYRLCPHRPASPWRYKKVITGNVNNQAVTDFIHSVHGDAGTNWLVYILRWTQEHQDVLLGDKIYETYLPKARSHTNLYDVPFAQQTIGDLEDDDGLINATDHLELVDCGKLYAELQWAMQDQKPPLVGKMVNLAGASGGTVSQHEDMPEIPKVDKVKALQNRIQETLLLLSANFEKGTKEHMILGKLSSLAQLVVSGSSQKEMRPQWLPQALLLPKIPSSRAFISCCARLTLSSTNRL